MSFGKPILTHAYLPKVSKHKTLIYVWLLGWLQGKRKTMVLFGSSLTEVESRLIENSKKTKRVFPEETERIEFGLALMRDVTQVTQNAVKDYNTKPHLVANHNLFARNRQLLLNAYFCLLCSSYGTQFVIQRVVLENSFLMRLFKENPQFAFEWLSEEMQKRFSKKTQLKYGKSGISNRIFKVDLSKRIFRNIAKKKARGEIDDIRKELSHYIHPNFKGWQELMGRNGQTEVIFNMPKFFAENCEQTVGITLYLIQLSFKAFVESFRDYLSPFTERLNEWKASYYRLIPRYIT